MLGRSADAAWIPFSKVQPPFNDYRDASYGYCTYKFTVRRKDLKIPSHTYFFLEKPKIKRFSIASED